MRRQVLIGVLVGMGVLFGVGMLVWASTQGLLGPYGKAKHLLGLADQAVQHGQLAEAQAKLEELVRTFPDSPWTDQGLLQLGQVYEQQQQLAPAQAAYQTLLEHFPRSSVLDQAQTHLGAVNVALLFSPTSTQTDEVYAVQPGDTLAGIANHHHATVSLLKRANGLSSDVIRPKQKLKIPTGHFSLVVDKSQNQMLVTRDDKFFKRYPVATGLNNSTPVGTFKIVNKIPNPVWYRQGAVVPPDSPKNILGTRWLGLDKPGYGIHGSSDPSGIGHQVTAGCVRMHNADVEEVFDMVPTGTDVTIMD